MAIAHFSSEPSVTAARPSPYFSAGLTDPILATRARARRRWAARTTVVLSLTGILLVLTVVWRRDTDTRNSWLRFAHRSAVAVQAQLDQTGLLPADLPPAGGSYSFHYASYYDRFYAQRVSRPVLIAISPVVPLTFRSDGRSVLIYENGKVRAAWMTIAEFTAAYISQLADQDRFEQERLAEVPYIP